MYIIAFIVLIVSILKCLLATFINSENVNKIIEDARLYDTLDPRTIGTFTALIAIDGMLSIFCALFILLW